MKVSIIPIFFFVSFNLFSRMHCIFLWQNKIHSTIKCNANGIIFMAHFFTCEQKKTTQNYVNYCKIVYWASINVDDFNYSFCSPEFGHPQQLNSEMETITTATTKKDVKKKLLIIPSDWRIWQQKQKKLMMLCWNIFFCVFHAIITVSINEIDYFYAQTNAFTECVRQIKGMKRESANEWANKRFIQPVCYRTDIEKAIQKTSDRKSFLCIN